MDWDLGPSRCVQLVAKENLSKEPPLDLRPKGKSTPFELIDGTEEIVGMNLMHLGNREKAGER